MNDKNNNKEKIIEKEENSEINANSLSRKIRLIFFILFIILTFLFNLEAIGLINKEYKYNTFYLKMVSFFILCLFPITEYDKMKSIMMFLPSIVLFYFNVTFIEFSPALISFLSFFTKIYSLAYLRIWIEQLSMINYKTLFIYMLNIIAFTGDKIAIVITKFISFKHNQVKILILQFLIFIFFIITPDQFFFVHKQCYHYHTEKIPHKDNDSDEKNDKNEEKDEKDEKEDKDNNEIISIFINIENEVKEKEQKKEQFKNIFHIFLNWCYIWSILGKASIYFLSALIDYALIDHCNKVLNNDDKDKIIKNYDLLVSILSIIGSIFGGILSIFIGGYDNIKSCVIVAISSTITVLANFCLFYSDSFFSILGSISLLFFFINVSMGDIEGYIIQSIPLKYKEFGLNFCGLISTIGCFLARSIYNYIKITFEKSNEFFAWRFCLICYLFGYFSILLACTFRFKDLNKIIEKKKKEIELDNFDDLDEEKQKGSNDDSSYDEEENEEFDLKKLRFNSIKTFDSLNS
jgi:hypothetical protein